MSIVAKDRILELLESGKLRITSTDDKYSFDPSGQIQADGVDLRLGTYGYVYRDGVSRVDTLAGGDPLLLFRKVSLPVEGFTIPPRGVLFCPTLEVVCLSAGEYIGRITGRSIWARFGLSIHCTQTKLASGIRSVIPLQLINHTDKQMTVYPRQRVVQLQLELLHGSSGPYDGMFRDEYILRLPEAPERERSAYGRDERARMFSASAPAAPEGVVAETDPSAESSIPAAVSGFRVDRRRRVVPGDKIRRVATDILLVLLSGALVNLVFSERPATPEGAHWKDILTLVIALVLVVILIWDTLSRRRE